MNNKEKNIQLDIDFFKNLYLERARDKFQWFSSASASQKLKDADKAWNELVELRDEVWHSEIFDHEFKQKFESFFWDKATKVRETHRLTIKALDKRFDKVPNYSNIKNLILNNGQ